MRRLLMIAVASAGLLASTAPAAAPIAGLINTGVDKFDFASIGSADGFGDNIWSLYQRTGFVNGTPSSDPPGLYWAYANYTGTLLQHPAWLANNATSEWISLCTVPNGGANCLGGLDDTGDGFYEYGMDFNLTAAQAGTASFDARFLVDSAVTSIKLNGNTINPSSLGAVPYLDWSSFSATSGFVAGTNELRITVRNNASLGTNPGAIGSNPTGLRVEFLPSSVSTVPEPGTLALVAVALLGLGAARRPMAA